MPLFAFPYTANTQKLITTQVNLYGGSKPLILWEREGEMLAAIKPQNCSMSNQDHGFALYATVGSLISNVHRPNRPGIPFVIMTALALAQSFGD